MVSILWSPFVCVFIWYVSFCSFGTRESERASARARPRSGCRIYNIGLGKNQIHFVFQSIKMQQDPRNCLTSMRCTLCVLMFTVHVVVVFFLYVSATSFRLAENQILCVQLYLIYMVRARHGRYTHIRHSTCTCSDITRDAYGLK